MSVEIICILDRSGSMGGSEDQVISSFNEFIKTQKKQKGKAFVTLALFDDEYEVILDRVKLSKVKKLTRDTYYVRGLTALYDSVGKTITAVDKKKKKAIVLIQTDGWENASQEYDGDSIKALIKKKEKKGWSFQFIGTDLTKQQTVASASVLGIAAASTLSHDKSRAGFTDNAAFYNSTTTAYRANT